MCTPYQWHLCVTLQYEVLKQHMGAASSAPSYHYWCWPPGCESVVWNKNTSSEPFSFSNVSPGVSAYSIRPLPCPACFNSQFADLSRAYCVRLRAPLSKNINHKINRTRRKKDVLSGKFGMVCHVSPRCPLVARTVSLTCPCPTASTPASPRSTC